MLNYTGTALSRPVRFNCLLHYRVKHSPSAVSCFLSNPPVTIVEDDSIRKLSLWTVSSVFLTLDVSVSSVCSIQVANTWKCRSKRKEYHSDPTSNNFLHGIPALCNKNAYIHSDVPMGTQEHSFCETLTSTLSRKHTWGFGAAHTTVPHCLAERHRYSLGLLPSTQSICILINAHRRYRRSLIGGYVFSMIPYYVQNSHYICLHL